MSSYAQTVCRKYPSLTIFFCFFKRTHATGSQLLAITGNKRKARQNMTRFFSERVHLTGELRFEVRQFSAYISAYKS